MKMKITGKVQIQSVITIDAEYTSVDFGSLSIDMENKRISQILYYKDNSGNVLQMKNLLLEGESYDKYVDSNKKLMLQLQTSVQLAAKEVGLLP